MNRLEATLAGEKRYRADKPCGKGHEPVRYTSNGVCCECISNHRAKINASRVAAGWGWPVMDERVRPEYAPALRWFLEALRPDTLRPDVAAILGAIRGLHGHATPRADVDLDNDHRRAEFERIRRRQAEAVREEETRVRKNTDPLTGEPAKRKRGGHAHD